MDVYQYALEFLRMGIAVVPVPYKQKAPVIPWKKYQQELPSENDLWTWFHLRKINYAIITGWQGLTVLDFDDVQEYNRWLYWTSNVDGITDLVGRKAFRVQSSRGVHVYIRLPRGLKSRRVGEKGKQIDIQSLNKLVVGPGSVHPSGVAYMALKPWIYLPRVETLSDVLPVEKLLEDTEQPTHVVTPARRAPLSDPWAAAANPRTNGDAKTVEKIKQKYPIETLFTELERTGDHYFITHCPLHDDEKSSMWIDTKKQICNCFACQISKPMDVINLYARMYGISNDEAIQVLKEGL